MTGLETISVDGDAIIEFTTDELTAFCPFDFGGADFYDITLRYEPDGTGVESRSLKEYFAAFRGEELTAEDLATTVHDDVADAISPQRCYVRLEQARRGGLDETVEVGDVSLRQ